MKIKALSDLTCLDRVCHLSKCTFLIDMFQSFVLEDAYNFGSNDQRLVEYLNFVINSNNETFNVGIIRFFIMKTSFQKEPK